jgi:hypothetical protein
MAKTIWTGVVSVVLFFLSQASAVTYYDLGALGSSDPDNSGHTCFERAFQVNNIVSGNPYSDCAIATSSVSEGGLSSLIWTVQASAGMKIDSLSVRLVFSGDAQDSGHIRVSYSTSLDGPWTEIVYASVPSAYSWYDQATSIADLGEKSFYYVKCEVLPTWVNHTGNANMWWKGFTLTGEESVIPVTAAPVFSPDVKYIYGPTAITITCPTEGTTIHYTIDGSKPIASSTLYTGPVTVTHGMVLRAVAAGSDTSLVTSHSYSPLQTQDVSYYSFGTLGNSDPANPGHSYFEQAEQVNYMVQGNPYDDCAVAISCVSEGGLSNLIWKVQAAAGMKIDSLNVRLIFSGEAQDSGRIRASYSASLDGPWTEIVNASVPSAYGWYDQTTSAGDLAESLYYVKCEVLPTWVNHEGSANMWWKGFVLTGTESSIPLTGAPVFSPNSEYIYGPTPVTITSPTEGAIIYYTTDGTKPTTGSKVYAGPVTVNDGTVLKAIAVGSDISVVTSQTYSFRQASAPVFSPGGKYISAPTSVTITSLIQGASIYYTIDGTNPSTASTLYQAPVLVSSGTTLKAIVVAQYYKPSAVTSVSYVVPSGYNRPATISCGSVRVDGDLFDWADATWAPMDQDYDRNIADDITEAYYAAKWQGNKIYVAVKVHDTAQYLLDTYTAWNVRDAIEIYLHTDSVTDVTYAKVTTAQQYIVGIKASNNNDVWTAIGGGGIAYPLEENNFSGLGQAAGRVYGEWLYYEVSITPYTYLGYLETNDLLTSVASNLHNGDVIGLDVNAIAYNGTKFTGVKSENMLLGKFANWGQFGLHKLTGSISGDANYDGKVDVGDLGILAANYGLTSGATWSKGDFNGDGKVDVGDLGILAANYGAGTSGADFDADYAKVFGTTVNSNDSDVDGASDNSSSTICSGLGLSLIAGLALAGLMLMKLEE